jgi:hypothetical protein
MMTFNCGVIIFIARSFVTIKLSSGSLEKASAIEGAGNKLVSLTPKGKFHPSLSNVMMSEAIMSKMVLFFWQSTGFLSLKYLINPHTLLDLTPTSSTLSSLLTLAGQF